MIAQNRKAGSQRLQPLIQGPYRSAFLSFVKLLYHVSSDQDQIRFLLRHFADECLLVVAEHSSVQIRDLYNPVSVKSIRKIFKRTPVEVHLQRPALRRMVPQADDPGQRPPQPIMPEYPFLPQSPFSFLAGLTSGLRQPDMPERNRLPFPGICNIQILTPGDYRRIGKIGPAFFLLTRHMVQIKFFSPGLSVVF